MASKLTAFRMTDADGYTRHGMDGEVKWEDGATVSPGEKGDNLRGPLKYFRERAAFFVYASELEARLYGLPDDGNGYGVMVEGDISAGEDIGTTIVTTAELRVIGPVKVLTIPDIMLVAWAICLAPHRLTRSSAIAWLSNGGSFRKPQSLLAGMRMRRNVSGSASPRAAAVEALCAALALEPERLFPAAVPDQPLADAMMRASLLSAARKPAEARHLARAAATIIAVIARSGHSAATRGFRRRSLAAFGRAERILAGTLAPRRYDDETA